ncbi:PREDICTED: signal transducer and activator of transcription 2 [Gavialis gangeticus]|uniref:signal transducer and activator of transcription 2 n=1 Tax=Gavialis gangeticus TaxID=94835 RepID=UPI00092F8164|nr:PREDICTED: signal transducer and activator of transcription 2 [Gavialis gangeticus]
MAQWEKVQELGRTHLEQVLQLYRSDLLPMEVRHCLAAWIEDQAWQQAAEPGSSQARMLLYALLAKLDEQYGRCNTEADGFVLQHNLRKAKHDLQARYEECPEELANVIANLLREEKRILSLGLEAQQQKIEQRLNEMQESMQNLERSVRHLEELQDTFDFVYKINQVSYQHDPLETEPGLLERRIREQLASLLRSAFVVEEQPAMPHPSRRQLVLRTNQKFSTCIRLLVKLQDRNQQLVVKMECDKDPPNVKGFRRFNILTSPNKTLMLDERHRKGLVCDFRHVTLKEQKAVGSGKGSKGASEGLLPVTEELHLITFTLDYKYQDVELQLQTSTLPVVVISNVCQASAAWASILWFNLLSLNPKDQLFFQTPPPAPWPVLAEALSWQFMAAAGRGLDPNQLHMLAEKLFGMMGLILGFVSKKRERQLLRRRQTGTFLLRFSESCREGGITFTWVEHGSSDRPEFCSVEPYTKVELESLPLADIIRDYHMLAHKNVPENPLKLLYPSQPRDEAFGAYYSNSRKVDLLAQRKYLNRRLIPVSSSFSLQDSPPGFSFWTWLEGILELIHKYLSLLWKDGLILGFVSKKRERQLLRRRQTGTFLLRFSESCREGGITFTWVEHGSSDRPEFCSVEPYTKVELESLPLADIIRDYHMLAHKNVPENPLKLLYPSQPRDEAFGAYYSNSRKVDLLAQRKYLNRRLIPVSSRQVDDPPSQTEEGAAPAPVVELEPRDVLGPEDLELIEGLSLEPGAMEQLEESLVLEGILPDVLQRGTDPYMPTPDDGVLLEPGSPESLFAEAGDIPLLQVDSRDFQ